ncbi:hypothetical protein FOA52_013499 [Chlamydomonas sp. UWO 241]|nr:hypothetical protein FOA52_013499 [Chlamydomonas sp. UWO 241]
MQARWPGNGGLRVLQQLRRPVLTAAAMGEQAATGEQGEQAEDLPGRKTHSSIYRGVCWNKTSSAWLAYILDPQTKRQRYIGTYAVEEDAARAFDYAAVKLIGLDAKRNFPGEIISERPATKGDQPRESKSSPFIGVSFEKARSAWVAQLWDPQTKRQQHIGVYTSAEDAARAYDCAAVKLRGPDTGRNFAAELISEPPATLGSKQMERKTSRFIGVLWMKARSAWIAQLYKTQTKSKQYIGIYVSEEDAARAYDCAAVKLLGLDAERNFPDELISELPESRGEERKRLKSLRIVSDPQALKKKARRRDGG